MDSLYTEKEKQLLEALELLNKENKDFIKNSKEYQIGRKLCKLMGLLNYHNLKKEIKERKAHKLLPEIDYEEDKDTIFTYCHKKNVKIAIYTCIIGNYDSPIAPLFTDYNCEYFLYTDNEKLETKIWQKRNIPEDILKLKDNTLINRYVKFHPHALFQDFDYSIYVDGNILIVSDVSSFINTISDNGISIHKHQSRRCIYDELIQCQAVGKGNINKLKEQVQRYKAEGMPEDYGLLECNVLVSDLKNEKAKKIFNLWWSEFLNSGGKRDQISLPYILWKEGITTDAIGTLGNSVAENSKLKIINHNKLK